MNDGMRADASSRNEMVISTILFILGTIVVTVTAATNLTQRRTRERSDDGGESNNGGDDFTYYDKVLNEANRMTKEEVLAMRGQYFSNTLSISYNNTTPLMITKGRGCYLYDDSMIYHDHSNERQPYFLDTRNNVAHVGHCHPVFVQVVQEQISRINTNTRYLHPIITLLAQQLLSTFPKPSQTHSNEQALTKVFFCNSGSEANDLALRLTRAYMIVQQQQQIQHHCSCPYINMIVVDHAYHGHTIATLDVSPYKYTHSEEYSDHESRTNKHHSINDDHNHLDQYDENDMTLGMHELPSPQHFQHKNSYRTRPTFRVQSVPCPNTYRGLYNQSTNNTFTSDKSKSKNPGKLYAQQVEELCHQNQSDGNSETKNFIGTVLMIESGMSVGGVILPPKNYIHHAVHAVRSMNGLYIADEIQTGLGRYGNNFYWGFQYNRSTDDDHHNEDNSGDDEATEKEEPLYVNPIPDIVTIGKGFGNGMPIAAVVCNDKVNAAFETLLGNVEVFNTFGGNPVCASAALMVLNIIEQEQLQRNATMVGTHLIQQLKLLQQQRQQKCYIGDVRGCGLFIGVEFVLDPITKLPATKLVSWLCSTLKDTYRILTSIDGPDNNVLVLKPPMVFSVQDANDFLSSLQNALLVDLPNYIVQQPDSMILQPTDHNNKTMDHTPT